MGTDSEKRCIFCFQSTLVVAPIDEQYHALTCSHCGFRGPKSPLNQAPSLSSSPTEHDLLRTVIDESPDIILMKNWEGEFLLCNRTLANLYGTTPSEMIGKSDADFNPNQE